MKQVLDNYGNKSFLLCFTIVWHEGTGNLNGQTFKSWKDVQYAFNTIYNDYMQYGGQGYDKVKIIATWENGKSFTDRIDVGNGENDYSPKRETIGQYLQRQKGVMYETNLVDGDRELLNFTDHAGPSIIKPKLELSKLSVNSFGEICDSEADFSN